MEDPVGYDSETHKHLEPATFFMVFTVSFFVIIAIY